MMNEVSQFGYPSRSPLELKTFKEIKSERGENKQCDDNEGF